MLTFTEIKFKEKPNISKSNRWSLILHNDDFNSFDYVIDQLISICNHTPAQAEQCALITHYKGKCDVLFGDISELESIKRSLIDKQLTVTLDEIYF